MRSYNKIIGNRTKSFQYGIKQANKRLHPIGEAVSDAQRISRSIRARYSGGDFTTKGSVHMSAITPTPPVMEFRVALTSDDYDRLVSFYCKGLGLEPAQLWSNDGGHAMLLDMGKATLELFDEAQAQAIDQIEAGQRISGPIRFALRVPDLNAAMERLLAHGAKLVHTPVVTPWGDYNVRLQDLDGLQVTLFQVPAQTTTG
jgi:methylmalonyl-CoA/ethylmalonyl-CoA epimerase